MSERVMKNSDAIHRRAAVSVINAVFRACEMTNCESADFVLSPTERLQVKKVGGDYEMSLVTMRSEEASEK